jgi:hypothetical protein
VKAEAKDDEERRIADSGSRAAPAEPLIGRLGLRPLVFAREPLEEVGLLAFSFLQRPQSVVDRLSDLGDARRADGSLRALEFQAGRFPAESARRDQPPRDAGKAKVNSG